MKGLKIFRMYAGVLVADTLFEGYLRAANDEQAWGIAYNYALRSNTLDSGTIDVEEVKIDPCDIPANRWITNKEV